MKDIKKDNELEELSDQVDLERAASEGMLFESYPPAESDEKEQ